ncbi:glycoside hydrolase family 28 protein [Shumkonia mesophila]|uniref:glycoside hydrolase family 28 protein n=1 Tax=Shumkonia mesophila TaxID=2838854 RepID=UPI0029350856|nr:glycoside hydrolase family 28 protein [Shumkonia mesophila]
MNLALLSATARTAAFEVVDAAGPDLDAAFPVRLDGEAVFETAAAVFVLNDLMPDTGYAVQVADGSALAFRTRAETAALDVRLFGAVGDGTHDDTAALQAAIAACPAGGTVIFGPGQWASGPLFLKSGTTLYLRPGATLKGHAARARYPILPGRIERSGRPDLFLGSWEGDPDDCFASLLTGLDVADVAIVGGGVIDGNAAAGDWWQWPKEKRPARRPRTLFFNACRDVLVQGVTICNSPSWTVHPLFSRGLRFHGLTIENPKDSPNTDGLDPESCEDVEIVGGRFSVGDDCIAIKSGKIFLGRLLKRPSRGIRIRRCRMEYGHGAVVIGSEMAGGVGDVEIGHCLFRQTDRGLRIKTRRGRGEDGIVDGIHLHDVRMEDVADPLVINAFYYCDPDGKSDYVQDRRPLPVDAGTPTVRNIRFERVEATGVRHAAAYVLGLPERPVSGLVVRDVRIGFAADAEPAPPVMACGVAPLARAGFVFINVEGPVVENVSAPGVAGPLLAFPGDQDP